jgi:2-amino-4-hydroxy-6-hydroxymethyldihydropteridine diphosphokinase
MSRWKSIASGRPAEHAYVGFGSNLGLRSANLARAMKAIREAGFAVLRRSAVFESEPWGGAEGENFYNAVLEVERKGNAPDFLQVLMTIEGRLGRTREKPNAPRTCDLDLLLWGDEVLDLTGLTVPHPRMMERKFVLVPICELIPDVLHPVTGQTMTELLDACPDPLAVWRVTSTPSSRS